MDALAEAGLSKVTVECTDPSGLLPGVQAVLSRRLPLKNLHWKSPSRPVRSIESLHIDLVPAKHAPDEQTTANDASSTSTVPHRRHQIPGLRQTPYLKIYLVRCDDETYKASSRKLLREWIKTHAATPQASGAPGTQDNHDAFEWLILHVLQDGVDPPEKAASTSKWPGRGTTSVLEKIKADFNGSSKSAIDRVAQIRLPRPGSTHEPPELIDQLNDLVEKMKNAILTSFDLRVGQYEEDIREKDSQRSLPGWNFCTFFILKEGLARGFENMGLLEDALVGYDELSAGLETAIGEYLSGTSDQHGGVFLPYTKDRKRKAEEALQAILKQSKGNDDGDGSGDNDGDGNDVTLALDEEHFPLDSAKKPYRDMILANNISIFDFRTYVFSRQLTLLLRAAGAPYLREKENPADQKSGQKSKPENLTLLAEVCERATEFISAAARTLRYDLECGLADSEVQADDAAKTIVINNIVSSWTYAAACQILSQTATPALTLPESSLRKARNTTDVAAAGAEPKPNVPRRSSSLLPPTTAPGPSMKHATSSDHQTSSGSLGTPKTGSEDLASGRGELCQLARGTLEEVGRKRGWVEKWKNLNLLFDDGTTSDDLEEVPLDNDEVQKTKQSTVNHNAYPLAGIELPVLRHVLSSRKKFYLLYEELADQMCRHYIAASRTRSAHAAMTEIGLLRFRQEDYTTAASYFHQIAPFYANSHWVTLEGTILELYARCLKELKQNDEYVRILLRLLSRYASYTQSNLTKKQKMTVASSIPSVRSVVHPYIEDLLKASAALQKECSVPLVDFFGDLEVDPEIRHYEDKDGFQLQLRLRFFLDKDLKIDSLKIRLVSGRGPQSNEIWLEHLEGVLIKSSSTKLLVGSSTTLQGKYFVDRIEMRAGNIVFTMGGGNSSAFPPGFRDKDESEEENKPYILCYPPVNGLEARLSSPHYINLEEMRTLEIELESGRNAVSKGVLRVRPATAGLRLRVAETTIVDGEINMTTNTESSNIEFVNFGPDASVRFRLPYTVDENHTALSARLEVSYVTDKGRFTYSATNTIVSTLPVSVNVQDIFQDDALVSRFTVSPAMLVPLRVLGCEIPNSEFYEVESSIHGPVALDVFPKQPASIVYKIRQRQDRSKMQGSKRSLRLTVRFTCLDEECLMVVRQRFRAAIEQSKFRHLSRLLTPHIVEAFRTQLSTSDMETIGLVREVEMLPFESVQWGTVVSALREPLRKEVQDWLVQWHQCNPVLTLPDPDPSILGKQIVIPVDVPEVEVVHTAELRLGNLTGQPDRGPVHAAVGHMIPAELHLRHTRRWSSTSAESLPLEFSYEIHANPELWLVGGRRRGNFTAKEGETRTFAIMLLPQRAGHLLLPTIDIKTFVASPAATTNAAAAPAGGPPGAAPLQHQRRTIHSELDYRSHGETVLVLPDLKKTTVSLEPGGLWLVDSESRIEA
ncbi:hypothetical protein VTN77DRAFT_9539 [Rasamsonia byssochlamydoides]|uniref:uncharacterized protein n=1 Tax=Rasamsonia byssochlamydoides TaxID=89139 RepID=UPI0037433B50